MANKFLFFKQFPKPFWMAVLSGILVGTSYIPFPGWALLFCYAPLWLAALELHTEGASLKKIFLLGWITQFILTLIGFNWIFYVASEFGNLHWTLSLATLILFACAMHIYIPLALVASVWIFRKREISTPWVQLLVLALTLALAERIWPSIFEWNLAYSLLWMKFPLYHWADMVGFWGLSTWLLLAQAAIAWAWILWRKNQKRPSLQIAGSVLGIIAVLSGLGILKEKNWSKTDSRVQFAITQANIGNADKVQSEKKNQFQSFILNHFSTLTEKHLQNAPQTELVLWPETAIPFALDAEYHNRFLQGILLQRVQNWNVQLVTGGYSQSQDKRDHLGYPMTRNSVFFIGPNRQLVAKTYNKSALLVFGEYMPFGEQFPFLYKLLPFVGTYERGPGPNPQRVQLKDKVITLGPQICYESLDPGFSRGLALKDSQVLFNVTNDSWFGWWAEPYQHNIMTLARGVEVRRPLVRATNTGISTVILANGQILEQSPLNQEWTHTYDIPYLKNPPLTFYARFGHWDWAIWLLLLIYLFLKGKYVRD